MTPKEKAKLPASFLTGGPHDVSDIIKTLSLGGPIGRLAEEALMKMPDSLIRRAIADYVDAVVIEEANKNWIILQTVLEKCKEHNIQTPFVIIHDVMKNAPIQEKAPEVHSLFMLKDDHDATLITLNKRYNELYAEITARNMKRIDECFDNIRHHMNEEISKLDAKLQNLNERIASSKENSRLLERSFEKAGLPPKIDMDKATSEEKEAMKTRFIDHLGKQVPEYNARMEAHNEKKARHELKNQTIIIVEEKNQATKANEQYEKLREEFKKNHNNLNKIALPKKEDKYGDIVHKEINFVKKELQENNKTLTDFEKRMNEVMAKTRPQNSHTTSPTNSPRRR